MSLFPGVSTCLYHLLRCFSGQLLGRGESDPNPGPLGTIRVRGYILQKIGAVCSHRVHTEC